MATFTKFNCLYEDAFEKKHNFGSDTLKIALTNAAPSAANAVLADITQIAAGNGYVAGGQAVTVSGSAQTSGVYKLTLADWVITAAGGPIADWRYAVLYNDTATNDELIAFYDTGATQSLADTQTFTFDFSAANGVLQVS